MNQEYIEFLVLKETKEMMIDLKNDTQSDSQSEYNYFDKKLKSSNFNSQSHQKRIPVPDSAILNHKQKQEEFKAKSSKNVRDLIKKNDL